MNSRNKTELLAEAQELVFREALYLDSQRWDDWLSLYAEDATFWMPAWADEHQLSSSPDRELSLMYCAARAGLEDRVWRVRSGLSVASKPLPRTAHAVSSCVVTKNDDATLTVESSWTSHVYNLKLRSQHVFFGRYEHVLRGHGDAWLIASKKIVLMNDTIPTMLDFYCI